ncbi:LacI family DNA-binding transcriptional regulator [Stappia sp. F7233]|uniref:LacI family DNA-binding transcriptional regulator n=1 Tax=Stappia albiluteola TaxID=2758565 RepID=A0A839AAG6_9HYPH|nr:LacI family DNA-binding transcriptional regulator [Stappia albiluteola]MBA5776024.1 LacI family DNA-binding transcriptional regulator [Stappia albiluteola]
MKSPVDRPRSSLSDVARKAGVSTATVSLALRDSPRIPAKTREKVRSAAIAVGYRYNRQAASLRTQCSMTVGLLITDVANPYFAALAGGAEAELERRGYLTFLLNSGDSTERQDKQITSLLEHGVDGILLSPAGNTTAGLVETITSSGVPVVQVSRTVAGLDCDAVGPDNREAAREAVRHLVSLGHRRIAFIGGEQGSSARRERLCGYRQGLNENGLAFHPRLEPLAAPTRENGAALARQLLEAPEPPTAALCYHDMMALGALEGAVAAGRTVGEDFAVVGFDDIVAAALSHPALTTVHIDAETIGREAARQLIARMAGDRSPPRRLVIPAHLVVRASCGAAASAAANTPGQ